MLGKERIKNKRSFLKNNFIRIEKLIKSSSPTLLKSKNTFNKKQFKKSLSEALLSEKIGKINSSHNLKELKIKEGESLFVLKKDFYKMKNIDLEKLKVYKNEKKEKIKQRMLFLEKENSFFNTHILDLIATDTEKEYRQGITNIHYELRNKKFNNKEEIKNLYEIILNEVKYIENEINAEINSRIEETNKRINSNINYLNILQENALDKKLKIMNIFMNNLKELIRKMETINKDYKKVKNKIDRYNIENAMLKEKIKIQNDINKEMILAKMINTKNLNEIKKLISYYKKYNQKNKEEKKTFSKIDNLKCYKKVDNRKNSVFLRKKNILNHNNFNSTSSNNQTNVSTNNADVLSKRNNKNFSNQKSNNSYKNIVSISNYLSTSSISYNKEKIDNEKNIIKNLEKNLVNLENKLYLMVKKLDEEIPQNLFYDLIVSIINKLKEEESDSVIFNIDNKFLTENMKMFLYQSRLFRQIFMDRLLNNKQLYKICASQRHNFYITFNKKNFEAPKIKKK